MYVQLYYVPYSCESRTSRDFSTSRARYPLKGTSKFDLFTATESIILPTVHIAGVL